MSDLVDAKTARSIVLNAQGFTGIPSQPPSGARILALAEKLGLLQIDSVNVLVRSHYLPLFSRLGRYPANGLDKLVYGPKSRSMFEYWGHEASLIPLRLQPLFRWRMERAARGEGLWGGPFRFAQEHPAFIAQALKQVTDRGPLAANELSEGGKSKGAWWGWSDGKRAMEYLFWTGQVTTATRRGNFERVYDLSERVFPADILNCPTPDVADAQRELVRIAARAMGISAARDLRDYFRLNLKDATARIAELVELGELMPVSVAGWRQQGYLWKDHKRRRTVDVATLLSPFDNLIWERDRTERLFGIRVKLEIYTPAAQRTHGYYVLPFLLGDQIVARVDLKADRQVGTLTVQAAHLEHGHHGVDVVVPLANNLRLMSAWLGLDGVNVKGATKFSRALSRAVAQG